MDERSGSLVEALGKLDFYLIKILVYEIDK